MMTLTLAIVLFQQDSQDRYVVMMTHGPKWQSGSEKQLDAHIKYWTTLSEQGKVFLGGPFADGSGGMSVLQSVSKEEAEKIAKEDPAVQSGLLKAEVKPWRVKLPSPDTFKVKFETSKGTFVIKVVREWSPRGADRFYQLIQAGYYDGCRFFRVISGFMAQFGIHGDPKVTEQWNKPILDDPVVRSNKRGFVSYAMAGPNTRTTQLFINFGDNARLDKSGFSPFGEVIEGMDVVDSLYNEYGEGAPRGKGPDQGRLYQEGNAYLEKEFPKLDFVKSAKVVE